MGVTFLQSTTVKQGYKQSNPPDVDYDKLTADDIVIVDIGDKVEGALKPLQT